MERFGELYDQRKRSGTDLSKIEAIRQKQETAFRAGNVSALIEALSEANAVIEGKAWSDRQKFADSLLLELDAIVVEPNQNVQASLHRLFPSDDRKAYGDRPLVTITVKEEPALSANLIPSPSSPPRRSRLPVFASRVPIAETTTVLNQRLLLPDGVYWVEATVEAQGQVVAQLRRPLFALSDFTERVEGLAGTFNSLKVSPDPKVKALAEQFVTVEFQLQRLAGINDSPTETLDPIAELRRIQSSVESFSAGANPLGVGPGIVERAYRGADGKAVPYQVYVPKGYNGKTPLPLVTLLHDALGDERSYFTTIPGADSITSEAERRGYLLVAPRAGGIFPTYRDKSDDDVSEVLKAISRDYSIDQSRIYLTGFGAGAFGTWMIASSRPETFAAIAPVSGGPPVAANALPAFLTALSAVPILVVHGGRDGITSPKLSRDVVAAARKAGLKVDHLEAADADHFTTASSTFPQVMDFFDKNQKAPRTSEPAK